MKTYDLRNLKDEQDIINQIKAIFDDFYKKLNFTENFDFETEWARRLGAKIKISNAPYELNSDGTIRFTGFSTEPLELLDIPSLDELKEHHRNLSILMYNKIPVMRGTNELIDDIKNFGKPKNRIPDRVVFNEDKGKVTVLVSKFNDGEAPYRAYTSKVHEGDTYNGYFGFFLSYYKYLNRHLDGTTRKELIDMAFEHGEHKEYIIEGAVSQEVLKLVKLNEWDNILNAIMEVSKQDTGYWDYAEWKEMLRVHELKTKREKAREVQKEIKKHQKEIVRLKKEV